jgi:hypothetical protein
MTLSLSRDGYGHIPPLGPPRPPAIQVRVFREVNGALVYTNGLVTAGESLIIGFLREGRYVLMPTL